MQQRRASAARFKINVTSTSCRRANRITHFHSLCSPYFRGAQKKSKKDKKAATKISFEQYSSIANTIATYTRQQEEESKPVTWNSAVSWYVEVTKEGNEEEGAKLTELCNKVIKNLIKKDGVLIFSGDDDDEDKNDKDRSIAVHPNYEIS